MTPRARLVGLVWLNVAASVLHFADNVRHFESYPEPTWISSPHIVDLLWFAITPLLIAGWWLHSRAGAWLGRLLLGAYGALGVTVLGHYLYGSALAMSFRMHACIWFEAAAAAALLVWVAGDGATRLAVDDAAT